jgi:hypothetical protein
VLKTCCPGIRHAYMGVCLLHIYLLCCVHGQDTSDFSGEKEERDRCPKHQFWCRTWHNCDCAYFSLDDSECCQKCGWGQYREEPPDNACKPCPDNTLFTDYKWDPRTKHPCLSCGDAFRMLEDYTKKRGWSPKHYEVYSNDFSHHKELQCIADMKKKCTDKERNLADVMVVSYSEANGRTCNFCHPPTYFFNGKCVVCPLGMQSATPLDDVNLFIPEDVKLANPAEGSTTNKYNREPAEFYQSNFAEFGCRACSMSQGVRDAFHTQCTPCAKYEYQLETYVDIQLNLNKAGEELHKTPIFLGNLKLYLGTSCRHCPPGFEFWNWQHAQPRQGQCRSSNPKLDCCRICRPNYFSTDGTECKRVQDDMATDKPFGATTEFACKLPSQLVYCNPQGHCSATNQGGWRACRPCYGTHNKVFYGTIKDTQCKNCQKNEYSDEGSCKSCSTCEGLLQTESLADIYSIAETDTDYPFINKIAPTTELTWKMEVIAADCYQLERRYIKPETEIINSIDLYSITQLSRIDPVPDFYTIVRIDNTCSLKRCDALCTEFFQHSPGCGQQETRVANIFVNSSTGVIEKYNVESTACKNEICNITHGPCTPCTTCSKGYFNARCNVYADTHLPSGYCQPCATECAPNQFMYHSHGEGACHNPAINYEAFPSGSNKWKIKEDYFCKQCPTWVYEAKALDNKGVTIPATMKTVTACGEREKYATYSWNEGSSLQLVYSNVEYSLNQNDLELGNDYKKFRHFHRDLVPYCPEAYYYNTKNLDCNTDQDSETYIVPATTGKAVTIGYSVYNPKCCSPCTTCAFSQKKDTMHWRACKGDSLEDTQAFCVDRCAAMSWQNETAKTCNACDTCQQGLL